MMSSMKLLHHHSTITTSSVVGLLLLLLLGTVSVCSATGNQLHVSSDVDIENTALAQPQRDQPLVIYDMI